MLRSIRKNVCFTTLMLLCFDVVLISSLVVEVSKLWVRGIAQDTNDSNTEVIGIRQTFDHHDYLFLEMKGMHTHQGVVHDPDCACLKSVERRQPSAKPQKTEGERYLIMPTVKEVISKE